MSRKAPWRCPSCSVPYLGENLGFICNCPLPALGGQREPICTSAYCTLCGWSGAFPFKAAPNGHQTLLTKVQQLLQQ